MLAVRHCELIANLFGTRAKKQVKVLLCLQTAQRGDKFDLFLCAPCAFPVLLVLLSSCGLDNVNALNMNSYTLFLEIVRLVAMETEWRPSIEKI